MFSAKLTRRHAFFPAALPDETLHSRISRYHRLSGNPQERQTLDEIFGTHVLVATANLPSHLSALLAAMPEHAQLSMEQLIDSATVLPYFRPFLRPGQVTQCCQAMASQNACGIKIGIGLVASRIGARNAFRYCRRCCAEDEQLHGSAYWHRAHNLPGVLVCHRHKDLLMELRSSLVHLHRHRLFLPNDSWVEEGASATRVPAAYLEVLFRLAVSSASLLVTPMPPIPAPLLRSFYREKAAGQGWIDHRGRIQSTAVVHASDHSALVRVPDVDLKFCAQPHWIFKLLHKHRTAMHPLKHLALLTLLGIETRDLHAYWQSNNDLAGTTAVMPKRSPAGYVPTPSQLDCRRERFVDQLKEIAPRRTQDYMWLYRHDYPWLKGAIAQRARAPKPAMQKVKWGERDQLLAAQIRDHAALLYQTDVSTRISATLLARATGKQALIEKFFVELPLTTRTIQLLEETVEAFQCRRMGRIVDESHARGEVLPRWRILRIAGLAPPLAPAVEAKLTALLKSSRCGGRSL
ncbi:TnsD family Tn7-like transposition protein [Massilia pseudoviolaceinigra]|uniref:TnsD family Tn7-like transposition protein n=1 Tax=Massilia pseudoviolaceinigra TaxID=3057165 RepID=UPI002796B284|nr:TnsD family Tn7-like transposition protein [Massilia sp. CCM 9206]MDQ1920749.1 TnsD family Tn7-like transposition protein [Massilia sp. CCM 9206]